MMSDELAKVEYFRYGVAQVNLIPSGRKVKVIIPDEKADNIEVGGIYSISDDYQTLDC